ncbi:hypothetical protein TMatcc_004535 [Talaromyces marneffei ATCC 18224]
MEHHRYFAQIAEWLSLKPRPSTRSLFALRARSINAGRLNGRYRTSCSFASLRLNIDISLSQYYNILVIVHTTNDAVDI